jgi:hypothetical protein
MIRLTFAERYQQARTYAAQVRVRKAMGQKYEHAAPWRGPRAIKSGYLNVGRQLTEPSFGVIVR